MQLTAKDVELALLAELAWLTDFELRVEALNMGAVPEFFTWDITRKDILNECLRLELHSFSH